MNLERITEFSPAYDGRPARGGGVASWRTERMKPDDGTPKTNYGICGVQGRMVLKGPLGAVQFCFLTNWYPPHVQRERAGEVPRYFDVQPLGSDVGYHSPTPRYEGQTTMGECEYLGGNECYYDGSTLRAQEWVEIFLKEGSDGIWALLEAEYRKLFEESTNG